VRNIFAGSTPLTDLTGDAALNQFIIIIIIPAEQD
jgi:hypothetical protein